MGVPYFKIKDIIKDKDIAVFSSHFTLYRDVSRRVFSVLRSECDIVEEYSIDEAFFVFNGSRTEAAMWATRVRKRIFDEVGIPVSIGIGATKTIAKRAVDVAKKTDGVLAYDLSLWEGDAATPLSTIWGVGGKLTTRFAALGLVTIADLLALHQAPLLHHFGVVGMRLQAELRGEVMYPVMPTAGTQKSIVSSRSFAAVTESIATLEDAVAYHVRHVAADLRAMNRLAPVISVHIRPSRHGDFFLRGGSIEVPLPAPTNDTIALLTAAMRGVQTLYEPGVPYKKAGVSVPYFVAEGGVQPVLFTTSEPAQHGPLMAVIDGINLKAGRELIQLGSRGRGSLWHAARAQLSPDYTTKWTDVAEVKAG